MAGNEHQAQQIVADMVVERGVRIGRKAVAVDLQLAADLLVLALAASCCGGNDRRRGAWRWPSARRPDWRERPRPAIASAPQPAPPARTLPPARHRARCGSARRSAWPARSATPHRWRGGRQERATVRSGLVQTARLFIGSADCAVRWAASIAFRGQRATAGEPMPALAVLPLIVLSGTSPRERGEAGLPRAGFNRRRRGKAMTLRPAPFSPFTGRRCRQADEGRRDASGRSAAVNPPPAPTPCCRGTQRRHRARPASAPVSTLMPSPRSCAPFGQMPSAMITPRRTPSNSLACSTTSPRRVADLDAVAGGNAELLRRRRGGSSAPA